MTCQDNFSPRNSPLISPLLPQTGTDSCTNIKNSIPDMLVMYLFLKDASKYQKNAMLYVRVVSDEP